MSIHLDSLHPLVIMGVTLVACVAIEWWLRALDAAWDGRDEETRHDEALDILQANGLDAHLYLPTVGLWEEEELAEAMDALRARGYIITDAQGNLVGKVAKARPTSDEIAELRRAQFHVLPPDA